MKKGYLLLCLALILALGMTGAAAEALDLPDNVLIIEEEAFLNCTSLAGTIELPEGIVTIGPSAFAGCTGLTGVPWIPDSVTAIGAHAFAGCTGLSGTLYLPEAMEVDDTAFENCPGLTVIRGAAAPIHVALILDGPTDGGDMNADCYKAASAWCADRDYDLSVVAAGEGAVDEAVAEGGNVIVMLGFMQAGELADGAASYPDAKFIGVDIASGDLDGAVPDNVFLATYREEQAGFMAGYAAVKLGYRHLGFLGGMDIPAVNRYGYGFVQGADAAAGEMGVANDVRVEFGYANSFAPTPEITDHMRRWYDAMGVEVVFACGGGIWGSVGGAIAETGKGKLIGVDIDQAAEIDGVFGAGTAVTSAMKNTGATVCMALDAIDAGEWAALGGTEKCLGVVSADPDENHVGLAPSTQFGAGFTRSDYEALTAGLYNGAWTVSDSTGAMPATQIAVNRQE